ncbi:MAG: hypothetical protein AAGI17_00160 [Planctomycetota bacterium]
MTDAAPAASTQLDPTNGNWSWEPQPAAQAFIDELVGLFLDRCPDADNLATRMREQTATRFKDWIGVILVPDTQQTRDRLDETGFTPITTEFADADIHYAFEHKLGLFPNILLTESDRMSIGIKVEHINDFFAAHQIPGIEHVQGEPWSRSRWCKAFDGDRAALWVMQRTGYAGFGLTLESAEERVAAAHHLERLRCRPRNMGVGAEADTQAIDHLNDMLDAAIEELGQDWACELFFAAERDYWMRRNTAARVQHARQNKLGLGWANHDHHTYRCSRENYTRVIAVFEKLGFFCRERFYAGGEAGWGAQVLEHPVTGIVIFADVDMSAEEVEGDFSHEGFKNGNTGEVGTVGLWVALHGESLLQAGMHHLECQFDHHALRQQLDQESGIKTMDPFTSFPFLRQAFTEGERWEVAEPRIQLCKEQGWITDEQAAAFRASGALGSHLENLERNDGYKGFNQTGVSDIISRTDARKHAGSSA